MKIRIVSALIGLALLFVILFFHQTILFNICVALVSVIGVFEFLFTTKYVQNKYILVVSLLFSGLVPFLNFPVFQDKLYMFIFCLFILYLIALFRHHHTVMFGQIAVAFTASLLIPFSFSTLVLLRDLDSVGGFYYLSIVFICAWLTDAGAYFTGKLFGKHKLAKHISPNKTVEGVIGGVIFCVVFSFAYSYLYTQVMEQQHYTIKSDVWILLATSVLGALIGMFGDLFASIIKRQTQMKDFGNLMPGHGGVLDRFDSVLFIAPFIFILLQFVQLITITKHIV